MVDGGAPSEGGSAAGLDGLPGDVLALVRDEERNKLRDVLWLLDPAEFDVTLHTGLLRRADGDVFLHAIGRLE